MKNNHLFAGIYIDNPTAYAAIIDQNGKALLCNQYICDLPKDDFPDIIYHLNSFALHYNSTLHIAFSHRWEGSPSYELDCPVPKNIIQLSHSEISQANLPHNSYGQNSQYDKPKLLALLGALKITADDSLQGKSLHSNRAA